MQNQTSCFFYCFITHDKDHPPTHIPLHHYLPHWREKDKKRTLSWDDSGEPFSM